MPGRFLSRYTGPGQESVQRLVYTAAARDTRPSGQLSILIDMGYMLNAGGRPTADLRSFAAARGGGQEPN